VRDIASEEAAGTGEAQRSEDESVPGNQELLVRDDEEAEDKKE
jgi:hypothetical protein